jgi:hypothetical protein
MVRFRSCHKMPEDPQVHISALTAFGLAHTGAVLSLFAAAVCFVIFEGGLIYKLIRPPIYLRMLSVLLPSSTK